MAKLGLPRAWVSALPAKTLLCVQKCFFAPRPPQQGYFSAPRPLQQKFRLRCDHGGNNSRLRLHRHGKKVCLRRNCRGKKIAPRHEPRSTLTRSMTSVPTDSCTMVCFSWLGFETLAHNKCTTERFKGKSAQQTGILQDTESPESAPVTSSRPMCRPIHPLPPPIRQPTARSPHPSCPPLP